MSDEMIRPARSMPDSALKGALIYPCIMLLCIFFVLSWMFVRNEPADTGHPNFDLGDANDGHPKNKRDVGLRLATEFREQPLDGLGGLGEVGIGRARRVRLRVRGRIDVRLQDRFVRGGARARGRALGGKCHRLYR